MRFRNFAGLAHPIEAYHKSRLVQELVPRRTTPKLGGPGQQVRIAAGSRVLLGAILGWFAHPGFVGLSAFVGAGLVFAGTTDTCGMGILLSRTPWNR